MKNLSILIATPAYGGLVTTEYLNSLLSTMLYFAQNKIDAHVYTLKNESLIPRGRNQCAWYALAQGPNGQPFDKVLFIDADMGWEVSDVERLLKSHKRVVGGVYPVKQYPIELACNALVEHREVFPHNKRSVESLLELRRQFANHIGEVEVRHIPTGFMLVDTSVFIDLIPHVRSYIGMDWQKRQNVRMWDFFPIGPADASGDCVYESEDWAFCSLVRKHFPDEGVWLNTHVVTKHSGAHTFSAGNV